MFRVLGEHRVDFVIIGGFASVEREVQGAGP